MFAANQFGTSYFGEAFIDVTAVLPTPPPAGYLLASMRLYAALQGEIDTYPALDGETSLKPS